MSNSTAPGSQFANLIVTLGYLAGAVLTICVVVWVARGAVFATALLVTLIGLVAVLGTLSRGTADVVAVLRAVTDLIHGRPDT